MPQFEHHPFARRLVNSGRLSVPCFYAASTLSSPDLEPFDGVMFPGAPADDVPMGDGSWLLRHLTGGFTLLLFCDPGETLDDAMADLAALADDPVPVHVLPVQAQGAARSRYDARHGTAYLIRPDQHVAARWRRADCGQIRAAVRLACGQH